MKKTLIPFCAFLLLVISILGCTKETIANRENLLIGKWHCIDYADSLSNEFKGRPPVFISNLYEIGYHFKPNNFMWTRNLDGSGEFLTNKDVDCEWTLSDDNLRLNLFFPDNKVEQYEIIKLTRKSLILKGIEGFWAGNAKTYVFEK